MSEGNEALAHRFHMDIFQEGNLVHDQETFWGTDRCS